MLTAYISGLPISAKEILQNALNEAYGDNTVDIQELTSESLRSKVRMSTRNINIILVMLDRVSSDKCKDIESGLYDSDKYLTYTTDGELVSFLNGKYGLNMVVEDEDLNEVSVNNTEVVTSIDVDGLKNYYLEKLGIKDDIIKNLESRINDLTYLGGVSPVEDSKEVASMRDEILSLNGELLDIKSELTRKEGEVLSNEKIISEYKNNLLQKESDLKKALKDLERVSGDLTNLKLTLSKQEGVIREKSSLIQQYEQKIKSISVLKESLSSVERELVLVKKQLSDKESVIANFNIDLESKNREIARYVSEVDSLRNLEGISEKLDSANATIVSLRSEIGVLTNDNTTLKKSNGDKDRTIAQLSETITSKDSEISEYSNTIEELENRVQEDDSNITQLNKEKLDLQSRLNSMEQSSTGSSEEYEKLRKQIDDYAKREAELTGNVFNKLGQYAFPNVPIKCKLIQGSGKFNSISFVFAGNSSSRKGSYKCLRDDLIYKKDRSRYLIVDLVTETSIDYVFEIQKVVPGIDWLRKGGNMQPYVSQTAIPNVQVLSMGLSYINDGYFLTVDWSKRLSELESSGYKVIIFCGDLSNMITRVMHESFVGFGESTIYVEGSVIGSRSIITNLRGLSNAKNSTVAYYAFNPSAKKFYEMASRSYNCSIVNSR